MNHPLTRSRDCGTTLSPIGGEGRGEGAGSWEGRTSQIWTRIGVMNRRSGVSAERRSSWQQSASGALPRRRYEETVHGKPTIPESRIGTMNLIVLVLENQEDESRTRTRTTTRTMGRFVGSLAKAGPLISRPAT